jgi:hypothetical protein
MATAEDRRVRLQGYADAKTVDRALRAQRGGGRLARILGWMGGPIWSAPRATARDDAN